jgi:hypothetical protein
MNFEFKGIMYNINCKYIIYSNDVIPLKDIIIYSHN